MQPVVRSFFVVFGTLFCAAASQAKSVPRPGPETQPKAGFVRLDRVTSSRPLLNGIELRSGPAIMQITALRDDVLRVRVGAAGQLSEDASWAVLPA